jgi:toxin ParE1/3/4
VAFQIIWTERAQEELRSITTFIAQDSLANAISVNIKIRQRIDRLSVFPNVGRFIPEISGQRYRQLIVYKYRIIYRVENECVFVVGVIHGARNFRAAFGDRMEW